MSSGCFSMQPQLQPTDMAALKRAEDRSERESLYEHERIRMTYDPRGKRYHKGDDPNAPKRGWQSLDAVLRSDANSAAALPERKLRTSRALFGVAIASSLVMVAGAAATAREALDTNNLAGPGAVLIAGSGMTLAFGLGAGITYGKARKGYEQAVEVYNDSLGLRLGLYDGGGNFIPPAGTLLDEDGFIILEDEAPVAQASTAVEASGGGDAANSSLAAAGLDPSEGASEVLPLNLSPRGLTSAVTQ
jgi:hypothetical protein